MKVALLLAFVGVALGGPVSFVPTRTGKQFSEVMWYKNDDGKIVPLLLHGKSPRPSSKAIEDDVQFYLYNNKNPNSYVEIFPGCSTCLNTFIRNAPVAVFAHGFSSSSHGGFGEELRTNFAAVSQEMNLIFVNWENLASAPWYETAADNTNPVGAYTAQLINFLVTGGYARISDFSFAGHSLGSHVGNYIARNLPFKLPVIHALDPALPLFGYKTDADRIDPSDADLVNVIHTAMGILPDGLAFTEPRGHVDFYPNWGKNQPGCGADLFGSCSHSRAHQYFGESAYRGIAFSACPCNNLDEILTNTCQTTCSIRTVMGWSTPSSATGLFYLRTNGESPYGIIQ